MAYPMENQPGAGRSWFAGPWRAAAIHGQPQARRTARRLPENSVCVSRSYGQTLLYIIIRFLELCEGDIATRLE